MKKRLLIIAFTLALSLIPGGCNTGTESNEAPKLLVPVDAPLYTVKATYDDLEISKYYMATVTPYVEEYVFTVSGTLKAIHVNIGEHVEKGELLAELDHSHVDTEIAKLTDELNALTAEHEDILFEYSAMSDYYNNKKADIISGKLHVTSASKEIEGLNCDIAIYEAKIRQATETYNTKLQGLTNQLERLNEQLLDYMLYAPMSGDVVYTSPAKLAYSGRTIVAVADPTRKYIQTTATDAASYAPYATGIQTELDNITYDLVYVPKDQDASNPNIKKYFAFNITNFVTSNKDMDMFEYGKKLLVTVNAEVLEDVLIIPNTAIFYTISTKPLAYVYIINEDGERVRRYVTLGKTNSIYTEVTDGLEEGDEIYVAY